MAYGNFVVGKFSHITQHLEDILQTIRCAALAARAGLYLLLGRAADSTNVLNALIALLELTRPTLNLCIFVVYASADISIAANSPGLVSQFLSKLNEYPVSTVGLDRAKAKCISCLQSASWPLQPAPVKSRSKLVLNSTVEQMLTSTGLSSAVEWSPEELAAELSKASGMANSFIASFQRLLAAFEHEAGLLRPQERVSSPEMPDG